jgi:hypothetical protein
MAVGDIVGFVIFKLLSDLRELQELLSSESKLARRLKPFVIFSSLEASSWLLVFALQQQIRSGDAGQLSTKNQAAIIGLSVRIDESGSLDEKYSRMPVLNLILFVLRSLAAFRGNAEFDPRLCEHWTEVEKVKRLRDRVAHPKGIREIELSDDELSDCEKAVLWLWDAIEKANGPNTWIKVERWEPHDLRPNTVTFGPEGIVVTELSSSPPSNESK